MCSGVPRSARLSLALLAGLLLTVPSIARAEPADLVMGQVEDAFR